MNIFENISKQEKNELQKCLQAVLKSYKKDEIIFNADEKVSCIYYVQEGAVELIKDDLNGNEIIIGRIFENETFAESFVCTQTPSMVCAKALTDTKILMLNFNRILNICSNSCPFHKKLLKNLLKIIAFKNIHLQTRLELLSKKTLRERILCLLSQYKKSTDSEIFEIPYSREKMAQFLGANRSALSRELSKLKNENLIDYHFNSFKINL